MFLKKSKYKNGRTFLSIVEAYRDENGKPKQRLIQKIGYLDDFTDKYDDPIAHFTDVAKNMTDEAKNDSNISLAIDMNATIDDGYNLFNVGYLPFKYIYNELGINDFFINKQRNLNIDFSLSRNLQLLVFSRILFPASKKSTYENRNRFFAPFNDGITRDSIYKSLDYFYRYKEEIQALIWKNTKDTYSRDISKSYYDCTNYYFEIEYNDDDIIDENGEVIEKGLRKRGPEKNHRPDPIVEMGLLMDASGIPLAYDLFPGNESEKLSLRPLLKKTKADFEIQRTIVVADRGLNTSDNIYYLAGRNDKESNSMDGYVYGQSVRGADKEFKEWVLNEKDYKVEAVKEDGEDIIFIHKSRVCAKEIKILRDGKRKVKVNVCQKQMVYFSFKYLMKQRNDRNKMIKKAQEMISNPAAYTRATTYGAAGYVGNLEFDAATGEIKNGKALFIDQEKIAEEEKYDGYYSIVTSEIELDDYEIRKIYRGLSKIEDTFKVSKTNFGARPTYVWTKEHIEGHFFTCFIALVIMRLLERKLGYKYTANQIITSAKKYNCINIDRNIYQFIYKDRIIEDISKAFNINLDKKYEKREKIKKLLKY